jgi:hypothetical protein
LDREDLFDNSFVDDPRSRGLDFPASPKQNAPYPLQLGKPPPYDPESVPRMAAGRVGDWSAGRRESFSPVANTSRALDSQKSLSKARMDELKVGYTTKLQVSKLIRSRKSWLGHLYLSEYTGRDLKP